MARVAPPEGGSWEWCTETAIRLCVRFRGLEGRACWCPCLLPPSCTYSHGLWSVLHTVCTRLIDEGVQHGFGYIHVKGIVRRLNTTSIGPHVKHTYLPVQSRWSCLRESWSFPSLRLYPIHASFLTRSMACLCTLHITPCET